MICSACGSGCPPVQTLVEKPMVEARLAAIIAATVAYLNDFFAAALFVSIRIQAAKINLIGFISRPRIVVPL
jgi:hypothetical protein